MEMRLLPFLCLTLAATAGPLRFEITLDASVAPHGSSGRMIVFLADASKAREKLSGGFVPGETWMAAMEFDYIGPGATVTFDPDIKAFPKPFSQAAPGDYEFMALLDPDHSYARTAQNEGDLYSAVVTVREWKPGDS